MNAEAERWIRALSLEPHPEGGWFRETYRSPERVPRSGLPERFGGDRSLATHILYLLAAGERSGFHRLRADEGWCHHAGGPLHLHLLASREGSTGSSPATRLTLSQDSPQLVVPHGTWFAAEPAEGAEFVLAGCSVSPGFEYADFELALRHRLLEEFPANRDLVLRFTRAPEDPA